MKNQYRKRLIEFGASRSEWNKIIDEWIFNESDRNILKRWLLDGLTIKQLADEFDFSVQTIKNKIYSNVPIIADKVSKL